MKKTHPSYQPHPRLPRASNIKSEWQATSFRVRGHLLPSALLVSKVHFLIAQNLTSLGNEESCISQPGLRRRSQALGKTLAEIPHRRRYAGSPAGRISRNTRPDGSAPEACSSWRPSEIRRQQEREAGLKDLDKRTPSDIELPGQPENPEPPPESALDPKPEPRSINPKVEDGQPEPVTTLDDIADGNEPPLPEPGDLTPEEIQRQRDEIKQAAQEAFIALNDAYAVVNEARKCIVMPATIPSRAAGTASLRQHVQYRHRGSNAPARSASAVLEADKHCQALVLSRQHTPNFFEGCRS
jgi:hypothetical protein